MYFWLAASVVAWGLLALVGRYWHPLGPISASTIVLAMGIGCVANWKRNRTLHCAITAPILLLAGTVFVLSDTEIVRVEPEVVWAFVIAGLMVAFLVEWRYARRSEDRREPGP
jgi:phosphatidylserine synthase